MPPLESSAFYEKLESPWEKGNFLCVGLDSDFRKIPKEFIPKELQDKTDVKALKGKIRQEQTVNFNEAIIDATHDTVCAFKLNLAFYEKQGEPGRQALRKTIKYLRDNHPHILIILDSKRGDIDNTNEGYIDSDLGPTPENIKAWEEEDLDYYGADAATVHPTLGPDAMQPFWSRKDKGTIVLAKTSNKGSGIYQNLRLWGKNSRLYEEIARDVAQTWNKNNNCAVVVGATHPRELARVRKIVGNMPILIPGIGAQGGDLEATVAAGRDDRSKGMIINSSRGIIFPKVNEGENYLEVVRKEALKTRDGIRLALKVSVSVQVSVDLKSHPEGLTEAQESFLLDIFDKKMFKIDLEKGFKVKIHKEHPEAPLSPLYINFRTLRAHPEAKLKTVEVFAEMIEQSGVNYDVLADIPTSATPLVASLSDMLGTPMITPRGDNKGYGSGDSVDGFDAETHTGKTVILFDDLATDGGSKTTPAKTLRSVGMNVEHVFILVDREQGASEQLAKEGLTLHSAFKLKAMTDFYIRMGRITPEQYEVFQQKMDALTAFIENTKKHPEGFTEEEEKFLADQFENFAGNMIRAQEDPAYRTVEYLTWLDTVPEEMKDSIPEQLKEKIITDAGINKAVKFWKRIGKLTD